MIAGPEIDHDVERLVGEWKRSHVDVEKVGGDAGHGKACPSAVEKISIDVRACHIGRPKPARQLQKRCSAPTPGLQDAAGRRQPECPQQQGDLDANL